MHYEIVKEGNLYVIVVEGRSIMKFKSRRQAAKVFAAAFQTEIKSEEPEGTADLSGKAA